MLSFDCEITNQDVLPPDLINPPAAVKYISLTESRLPSHLTMISRGAADAAIAEILRGLVVEVRDIKIAQEFLDPKFPSRELVRVLQYVSPKSRIGFIKGLAAAFSYSAEVNEFVESKLDNALYYCSQEEKSALCLWALQVNELPFASRCIPAILGSSRSLSELKVIIGSVGENTLIRTKNAEILEYVASGALGSELRLPLRCSPIEATSSIDQIFAAYDRIQKELEDQILVVVGRNDFVDTNFVHDYAEQVVRNLDALKALRGHMAPREELCASVNAFIARVNVERRYWVTLTTDGPAQWREVDLEHVGKVLSRIPENVVLFTPLITEIRLSSLMPWYLLGLRYGTGLIEIGVAARDNESIAKEYDGASSLEVVLSHEIGHGIQIGRFANAFHEGGKKQETLILTGDPQFDFDDFVAISGWRVIAPARYSKSEREGVVVLDGNECAVGSPVKVGDEELILVWSKDSLFAFNTKAPFSRDPYARTNPWEDWAEAFSEYMFLPDRLKRDAMEKFRYFNLEFHLYPE